MAENHTNKLNISGKIVGIYLPAILSFCLLVGIDQFVKYLVYSKMELHSSIVVWQDIFEIHYIQNSGAAWGLFENKQVLFIISSILVLFIGIFLYIKCINRDIFKDIRMLIILILSGAVGNMIDRIRFQYVVDFLYFKLIDFPVFNIADCYVTIGFIFLIILILFKYKDEDFEKIKEKVQ